MTTEEKFSWYEELYGQMLDHSTFVVQYKLLIEKYPDWKMRFYEENPVAPYQYNFIDDKKYKEFEKFVMAHDLSVDLKTLTTGE